MYADDYGVIGATDHGADYEKDPDETVDYGFDWSGRLDGDTISTLTWLLPDGLSQVSATNDSASATIFVSGGEVGRLYRVTNRIVTTGGRTWEKTIRVAVVES